MTFENKSMTLLIIYRIKLNNTWKINKNEYYTLRFYFPYLSLLVQPVNILVYWLVNILVYWPDPINIMFSSGFGPNSFFVLDKQ